MPEIVTVDNLSYAYPVTHTGGERNWVLQGVNLKVSEGEFVSIMGPTGVGKTTLCLALNGIVPQSTGGVIKGDVLINGLNTKRTPVPELAQHVGMVFQEPETQLFSMSVEAEVAFGLESLGFPPKEIVERVEWALAAVGMSDFRQRSPFSLSGGQKQRTAIAAILAMTPNILVLDEPTASLDPMGKTEVFSVVRKLRSQRRITIIMVDHESEHIAEFSDRVLVLHNGQIALAGEPAEVFSQIDQMQAFGLAVPQVSELANCLNRRHGTNYFFLGLEEAYNGLTRHQADARQEAGV